MNFGCRQIPLFDRWGQIRAFAVVDAEDYDRLNQYRWHFGSRGYARSKNSDGSVLLLHRHLLGLRLGDERQGDHINRDRLDNRRCNLRIVSRDEQMQNRKIPKHNTSGWRGVYFDPDRDKWRAEVRLNRKRYRLGQFATAQEAGEAARAFRQSHMPLADN